MLRQYILSCSAKGSCFCCLGFLHILQTPHNQHDIQPFEAPKPVKEGIAKAEAEEIAKKITEAGGTAEVK